MIDLFQTTLCRISFLWTVYHEGVYIFLADQLCLFSVVCT